MIRRGLAALALVASVVAVAPAGHAFHLGTEFERAWWGDVPSEVEPGEHGRTLTVQLRNVDDISFYAVEATLLDHANLTPSYQGAELDNLADRFEPGDLWMPTFIVDLDDDLPVGEPITVEVEVTMRAAEDGGHWSEGDYNRETFELSVPVPGRTRLDVSADDGVLPFQSTVDVDVTLANVGSGRAGTLDVAFAPSADSELGVRAPQAPVRISSLGPGDDHTITTTLLTPPAQGVHGLDVTVTYVNAVGTTLTETFTVPLTVGFRNGDAVQARLLTPHATTGKVTELVFSLTNTDDEPRDAVQVTIEPRVARSTTTITSGEAATLNGTGVIQLGRLDGDSTTTFTVPVYVSRDAGDLISLDVTLQWNEPSGQFRSATRTFGLVVEGAIELDITGLSGQIDALAGKVIVQGTLTNTGNVEATNAYLRIMPAPGLAGTEPIYQGDLDPDSPIPFTLVSNADPDRVPNATTVLLTWTDDMGQAREIAQDVALVDAPGSATPDGVDDRPSDRNPAPGPGALVVLAALATAGLAAVRRGRGED